jgi:FkbM family methyltransferase
MSLPRRLLERVSRRVVLKRRLGAEFGRATLWVSPGASLSFWRPQLNSDLFTFAAEYVKPGSVVWDIGANVGLLSIAAAQLAGPSGQVVAVEADLWLAALLQRSAAIQGPQAAPVRVVAAAMYRELRIAQFHIAQRSRATNYLALAMGSSQTGGVRQTVDVVTLTLDWLLDQCGPPQVLKIDVEGAEADVLRGGQRVLSEARPVLLCEVYDENSAYVTETLHAHNYRLFDWDARPLMPVATACYNTLALPAERLS